MVAFSVFVNYLDLQLTVDPAGGFALCAVVLLLLLLLLLVFAVCCVSVCAGALCRWQG
jgi:hypothetical protein